MASSGLNKLDIEAVFNRLRAQPTNKVCYAFPVCVDVL